MPKVVSNKLRPPALRRVKIHDLAKRCGLSITTISQALNLGPDECRVSSKTRVRVKQVALELGYRPSKAGRALAIGRSQTVGILYSPPMPVVMDSIYAEIVSAAAAVLQANEYHLLLVPLGDHNQHASHVLADQMADGYLVLNNMHADLRDILKLGGTSAVLVNLKSDLHLSHVLADDIGGMQKLVRHLLDLGHRRITYYCPASIDPHCSVQDREQAFLQTMREAGLSDHACIVASPLRLFADSMAAPAAGKRPTAIIVYAHQTAIPLLRMLWERGVRVPADLSVATFNDVDFLADTIPPMTTVAIPTRELGQSAAHLLIEQLKSARGNATPPTQAQVIVVAEHLVIRASTAPPAG